MRELFELLTAFDWISPIIHTVEDAGHGFGGRPLIFKKRYLEEAQEIARNLGIESWAAERYGPFVADASLTVNDEDYDKLVFELSKRSIKVQ